MTFVAWATLVAAVAAAGVGVFGALLQRRTGREATAVSEATAAEEDRRAKREELMRLLRWAAELAVDPDEAKAELGISELQALSVSPLLDEEMVPMVDAALVAVVVDPAEDISAVDDDGDGVLSVEADEDPGRPPSEPGDV